MFFAIFSKYTVFSHFSRWLSIVPCYPLKDFATAQLLKGVIIESNTANWVKKILNGYTVRALVINRTMIIIFVRCLINWFNISIYIRRSEAHKPVSCALCCGSYYFGHFYCSFRSAAHSALVNQLGFREALCNFGGYYKTFSKDPHRTCVLGPVKS